MQAETANPMGNTVEESTEAETTSAQRIDLQPLSFADLHDGPEYENTSVTLELTNSHRIKGKLLQFNAASELVMVMEPRAAAPTEVEMVAVKYLRLEKPYQIVLNSTTTPGINIENDSHSFEIYFKDRSELSGNTFGTRTDQNGIHLYEQTKVGRKWRYCSHLFVAHAALENHIIGGQIGEILEEEKAITIESLELALEDQQEERTRLLGEYLVTEKIVDASELENALSRQKNMPNLKLAKFWSVRI